jgi:sugar-specific transcriptional regulator TrmB
MRIDLLEKLVNFGLPINQAKVYASVVCFGCTSISQIAENTGLHSQDIYKTLIILEKKGLLLRTINRPIKIESIPIEKALQNLVEEEKNRSQQRLLHLATDMKDICRMIKDTDCENENNETKVFIIHGSSKTVDNIRPKIDLTFDNVKKAYDKVLPDQGLYEWKEYEKKQYRRLVARGAKIRNLVLTEKEKKYGLQYEFAEITPKTIGCELRTLQLEKKLWFVLIDDREAWIPLDAPNMGKKHSGTIVTDSSTLVAILRYEFETLWNHPKVEVLLPKPNGKEQDKL